MSKAKHDISFWTKYKKFATTEILMYLIMVIGIAVGILILS
ncbi:hypothetical protein [Pedobacter nyackensis]|uniref:Uncharacterized protein n=1 Tax=Pedobacter nyackensis TaxID=475255 RepID=A0A1W2DTR0_9SPHI|nr:hypothetical protein [Pedobacter nyackensis]SMD00844.1 hypothetical protein SAMN04488101_10895 [Pedobacter nyackensis]